MGIERYTRDDHHARIRQHIRKLPVPSGKLYVPYYESGPSTRSRLSISTFNQDVEVKIIGGPFYDHEGNPTRDLALDTADRPTQLFTAKTDEALCGRATITWKASVKPDGTHGTDYETLSAVLTVIDDDGQETVYPVLKTLG